jgi:hypothetical protein
MSHKQGESPDPQSRLLSETPASGGAPASPVASPLYDENRRFADLDAAWREAAWHNAAREWRVPDLATAREAHPMRRAAELGAALEAYAPKDSRLRGDLRHIAEVTAKLELVARTTDPRTPESDTNVKVLLLFLTLGKVVDTLTATPNDVNATELVNALWAVRLGARPSTKQIDSQWWQHLADDLYKSGRIQLFSIRDRASLVDAWFNVTFGPETHATLSRVRREAPEGDLLELAVAAVTRPRGRPGKGAPSLKGDMWSYLELIGLRAGWTTPDAASMRRLWKRRAHHLPQI